MMSICVQAVCEAGVYNDVLLCPSSKDPDGSAALCGRRQDTWSQQSVCVGAEEAVDAPTDMKTCRETPPYSPDVPPFALF